MSYQPNLKRKAPPRFDWQPSDAHIKDGQNEDVPRTVRIKHTDFHLDPSGSASTRTTFIPAPASPEKAQHNSRVDEWDNEASVFGPSDQLAHGWDNGRVEDEEGDEEVDAQYQRHLDMQEPGVERTRRKRSAAVSSQLSL